jgi:hypothetical protein
MSTYAYIHDNKIVELKEISDTLYSSWIAESNPKKDCYRLVVYTQQPSVSSTEVAESSFTINQTTVNQVWTIRNKTADELRITWTAYQFLNRFTYAERAAYRVAAKTDDIVADFMGLAQAAQEVLSDDPTTIQGMDYLVSIGVLTQQRRNEILSNS